MFYFEEHLWHKNLGKHGAQAIGVPYNHGIRNTIFLTLSLDVKEMGGLGEIASG